MVLSFLSCAALNREKEVVIKENTLLGTLSVMDPVCPNCCDPELTKQSIARVSPLIHVVKVRLNRLRVHHVDQEVSGANLKLW